MFYQCFHLRKWEVVATSEGFNLFSAMIPCRHSTLSNKVRDCGKSLCTKFHLKNKSRAQLLHASFFKALNQFSAIPRLSPVDSFSLICAFHREKNSCCDPSYGVLSSLEQFLNVKLCVVRTFALKSSNIDLIQSYKVA